MSRVRAIAIPTVLAVVAVLALLVLPAAAQEGAACQKGQSVRDVDKETGVVIQKTRLTPKPDSFDPLLVWTSDEPGSLMFVAMGNSAIERYPTCYQLTILADGKTLSLGKVDHNSETGGSRTVEYVTSDLTLAEAQRLASAKAVTFKICNDEFQVNPEFLCQAREVLEAATAWKKAPPPKKK
jgi:hypothetical protein